MRGLRIQNSEIESDPYPYKSEAVPTYETASIFCKTTADFKTEIDENN
jgi:hypothetical protein